METIEVTSGLVKFIFDITSDYGTGVKIRVVDENDDSGDNSDSEDEGFMSIDLPCDIEHNKLYLVFTDGIEIKFKLVKTYNEIYNHIEDLRQLYSDINGSLPFVCTSVTCGYKEIGYYPEALPKSGLVSDEIKFLTNKYDFTIGVTIKDGFIDEYMLIQPEF